MKRSLTVATILTAAIVGSGAWLAVQAHGASEASAPGKASCCADKTGVHKHACGDKDAGGCDHKGMNPEMAAKMAEMDKRMDAMAAKMNSAKGDDKVDAMAAVINEMLARRKAMHEMMHDHHGAQSGGAAATDVEKTEGLLGEQEHSH